MENRAEKIVEILGGQTAVAASLGIKYQSVAGWIARAQIPAEQVLSVYELLERKIPLYEIRPDLYPKHILKE